MQLHRALGGCFHDDDTPPERKADVCSHSLQLAAARHEQEAVDQPVEEPLHRPCARLLLAAVGIACRRGAGHAGAVHSCVKRTQALQLQLVTCTHSRETCIMGGGVRRP